MASDTRQSPSGQPVLRVTWIGRVLLAGLGAIVRWFGWWSVLLLLVTLWGMQRWWTWDQAHQVPLPPQVDRITQEIYGALLQQTTFRSLDSPDHLRAFYRELLLQRGWQYCGTQATPGCTNLVNPNDGSGARVDVYRRPDDRDQVGPTMEVKAVTTADGSSMVIIWEANRYPRQGE